MNPFEESPNDARFRGDARRWLEANAPDANRRSLMKQRDVTDEVVSAAREWQRTLFSEGWAGISWPTAYGGGGQSVQREIIFREEAASLGIVHYLLDIGLFVIGPTIMEFGTFEQKEAYLTPILSGDEIWCQLLSEPGAGSDLGSIRTRAVHDGDAWLLDGQKLWTTGAHYGDRGALLARTADASSNRDAFSYFLVDLRAEGIEVRPIRQSTGYREFNEVYLSDVRVSDADLLGEANGGWGVLWANLAHERLILGGGNPIASFEEVRALADRTDMTADPKVRERLVDVYVSERLVRLVEKFEQALLASGRGRGPEGSLKKLLIARHARTVAATGLDLLGGAGALAEAATDEVGFWQHEYLKAPAFGIGGGTNEMQLNIIGERLLGLPKSPKHRGT